MGGLASGVGKVHGGALWVTGKAPEALPQRYASASASATATAATTTTNNNNNNNNDNDTA